jgi:hypothetical protein
MKEMLVLWAALWSAAGQAPPADLMARVAEEAEILEQNAPQFLTQETLEQRALVRDTPKVRIGKAAGAPPKEAWKERTVVSEYTVAPLKGSSSRDLLEFREVVSVDGRSVRSVASARHALSLGIKNPDDRVRRRMLEDFARYGLEGVATDYAMILLAFTSRGQGSLVIQPAGTDRIGADQAALFGWRQSAASQGELLFAGPQASRLPLAGKLWVRMSDGRPLRVWVWAAQQSAGHVIRDEATVDYVVSPHGFMAPASVHHQHLVDGDVRGEDLYRYEPFKLFGAESELKFSPEEAPPPTGPAPPR